ncbi:MAG TPA: hypothetical protein VF244_08220 [Acidimicrobiales bacterium]
MLTFGEIPPYQYGVKFDPALSDDKLALTLTFSDFEATVKEGGPLVATRKFSLVLPIEGDGGRAEIPDDPTECRPYGLLLVGRDSTADAAFLNITAIDAEVRPPTS